MGGLQLGGSFAVQEVYLFFFTLGSMVACFNAFGTCDEANDLFIICWMTGTSSRVHGFRMVVGIGSWTHELFDEVFISFSTYSTETV